MQQTLLPGNTPASAIYRSSAGGAVGFIHQIDDPLGQKGLNKWSLQYGFGSAENFAATILKPTDDLRDAWRFRFTEQYVVDRAETVSWMLATVYDHAELRSSPAVDWLSFGARPMLWLTDHLNLTLEAGFDCTRSGDTTGCLSKLTFAPSLAPRAEFFSRPSLRMFITWARWASDFEGQIAPSVYPDEQHGFTYGVQAESWW